MFVLIYNKSLSPKVNFLDFIKVSNLKSCNVSAPACVMFAVANVFS